MPTERCCLRCGHSREEWTRKCSNCHTEFWCRWDPNWYDGRLTRISLGQDQLFRKLAIVVVSLGVLVLIYGLVLQVHYANEGSKDIGPLMFFLVGNWALFEIWAFFHGRPTHIDHMVHAPRPENTWWRSVGLFGDIAVFVIVCKTLYSID